MTHFRTAVPVVVAMMALASVVVADSLMTRVDMSEGLGPHYSVFTQNQCLPEGGRLDLWIHNIGEEALQFRGGPSFKVDEGIIASLYIDYWTANGDIALNPEINLNRTFDGLKVFANIGAVIPIGNDRPNVLQSPETNIMRVLSDGWAAGLSMRWCFKENAEPQFNCGPCVEKRDRGGCWYGRLHLLGTDNVGTKARFQRTFNINF